MDHAPHQPLLATADAALAEELTRLSAAAGAAVEVASTGPRCWAPGAPRRWCSSAPTSCRRWSSWRRHARPGVQVVAWSPAPTGAFRDALLVGAERVVELPVGAELVAELLTDLEEVGRGEGVLVGVVGGSGGAGATTLACALGQVAAARGPTLVVDLDPLGPGCDRVLALDDAPGVRWDSLGTASGRLSGRSLREAVPRRDGPGRAGLGRRLRLRSTPARSARRCRRRAAATTPWSSTCPRSGDLVAETVARCALVVLVVRADGHRCRRRGPVGGRAARPGPGRAGGPWSRCRPATGGRARRRSRCSRPWPTSAGWPRPSTWGWARSGRVADRSPPRPVSSSPASTPRRLAA